jgi:hypothetical protein
MSRICMNLIYEYNEDIENIIMAFGVISDLNRIT